jgi:hypothetical protein
MTGQSGAWGREEAVDDVKPLETATISAPKDRRFDPCKTG